MLELRPNCECCDRDLPGDSADALICSFECTFCRACNERQFQGRCPNCGGQLLPRPARVGTALSRNPASHLRVLKPHPGCS
ncbi:MULTISPECIES: DUF1272 domain-containing protein [Pseudomonas]|uniref:DUF1272 domain-containing protein n=1 Tax=Pseudomonas guariconensis TaxID=1288410 RepID=A0AAX0VW01_9PSED|nr:MULTISPECIES: DUF1272 domain-containing protein [Pseudomonas]MBL3363871.1 DUF1272 domain-containing protein [Klebsiella pneumoniae]MBH3360604.1 DUF1272 domain-containing protein [Pseudomonas guariconensis]MCO7623358.1 DUF1272 domain-containing protein [Pseudomonas guariconensis]MDD2090708.1 DUF1272 domain-containing protein [Pseudomonas guariconensis]MDM9594274.1 DUF1272 domain-containing protein [Pseudomonas guariconensis]